MVAKMMCRKTIIIIKVIWPKNYLCNTSLCVSEVLLAYFELLTDLVLTGNVMMASGHCQLLYRIKVHIISSVSC